MNDRTMGQRIAQCRKNQNLSQEALGERMGVSRQAISKWESDAAVPEIDKLIALSRLFDVSVGWLLGVEENLPQQDETLSDTQLKMVEEIVKRYQPTPRTAGWGLRVVGILAIAAVAITALLILNFAGKGNHPADNSEQLSSLQASYSGIQSQLSGIGTRLDALENAYLERLLLSYQLRIDGVDPAGNTFVITSTKNGTGVVSASVDIPTAAISFAAVPKAHTDTDTAFLTAISEGTEMQKADCQWNGASYTGKLNLPIPGSYQVCFTICHADGTQEQQMLDDGSIENLAEVLCVQLDVETGVDRFAHSQDHDELTIANYVIYCTAPVLYTDANWESFGMVLYRNGEEIGRCERNDHDPDITESDAFQFYAGDYTFEMPTLQEGDRLELRAYAATSSGNSAEKTAGLWLYTNGALEPQPYDPETSQINRFRS